MSGVFAWIQAARPLAAANILIPIAFGATLAATRGALSSWDWLGLGLAFGWGLVDMLFIVFANDVADEAHDRLAERGTLVSGGSRVLVENKISRRSLIRAAGAMALLLLLGSILLATFRGAWALPACAVAALILLWAYSFAPLRLSYRGGGAALQGLGLGVVLVVVGWQLQGAPLSELSPAIFVAPCLMGVAGNFLTARPDLDVDTRGSKRSRPVQVGASRALFEAGALMAVALSLSPLALPELAWQTSTPAGAMVLVLAGLAFALDQGRNLMSLTAGMLGLHGGLWALAIYWLVAAT